MIRFRPFRLLLGLVLAVMARGQSLSPSVDPVCGAPRVSLTGTRDGEVYQIQGSDDLGSPGVWTTLLRVVPGASGHLWFDPDTLARGRRFYRLQREELTPELQVPNFALLDQRATRRELFREGDASAVVLVFTDNAHLRETWAAVQPLVERYRSREVRFWLVNSRDDRVAIAEASASLEIPVLHDPAEVVARTYGVNAVLESVAISQRDLTAFYRGPVSDRCELPGAAVDQPYLQQALDQFLSGGSVVVPAARARGAALTLAPLEVPRYASEIAPLLQARCVTCHRPGDIGSWAMTNHASVVKWADSIRRQVLNGNMPPWHADAPPGHFANDSSLSRNDSVGEVI